MLFGAEETPLRPVFACAYAPVWVCMWMLLVHRVCLCICVYVFCVIFSPCSLCRLSLIGFLRSETIRSNWSLLFQIEWRVGRLECKLHTAQQRAYILCTKSLYSLYSNLTAHWRNCLLKLCDVDRKRDCYRSLTDRQIRIDGALLPCAVCMCERLTHGQMRKKRIEKKQRK